MPAVFSCVQAKVWLPVLGSFNVHTDVNACDCTRGLYGHRKRVGTKSWLVEKSLGAPGNRTCLSGVPVRRSTNRATSPPHNIQFSSIKSLPGFSFSSGYFLINDFVCVSFSHFETSVIYLFARVIKTYVSLQLLFCNNWTKLRFLIFLWLAEHFVISDIANTGVWNRFVTITKTAIFLKKKKKVSQNLLCDTWTAFFFVSHKQFVCLAQALLHARKSNQLP